MCKNGDGRAIYKSFEHKFQAKAWCDERAFRHAMSHITIISERLREWRIEAEAKARAARQLKRAQKKDILEGVKF